MTEKVYDKPLKVVKLPMFNRYSGKPEWVDGKPSADKLTWSVLNDIYISFTVFLKDNGGMINHSMYIYEFTGIIMKVSELLGEYKDCAIQYNLSRDFYNNGAKSTVETSVIIGKKDNNCFIGFSRDGMRKVKFGFEMVGDNELVVIKDKENKIVENMSPYLAVGYFHNLLEEVMKNSTVDTELITKNVGKEQTISSKKKDEVATEDDDIPF